VLLFLKSCSYFHTSNRNLLKVLQPQEGCTSLLKICPKLPYRFPLSVDALALIQLTAYGSFSSQYLPPLCIITRICEKNIPLLLHLELQTERLQTIWHRKLCSCCCKEFPKKRIFNINFKHLEERILPKIMAPHEKAQNQWSSQKMTTKISLHRSFNSMIIFQYDSKWSLKLQGHCQNGAGYLMLNVIHFNDKT